MTTREFIQSQLDLYKHNTGYAEGEPMEIPTTMYIRRSLFETLLAEEGWKCSTLPNGIVFDEVVKLTENVWVRPDDGLQPEDIMFEEFLDGYDDPHVCPACEGTGNGTIHGIDGECNNCNGTGKV